MKIIARPYQADAIESLRALYREGFKAPLLVLPTGGGKTVIFSFIAEGAAARGNAVTIVVHRQELLLQASANLESIGLPHGVIAPGHTPTRHPVQVASINTLVRRLGRVQRPALVVFDEGHHATAGMWGSIVRAWPDAALLGVTATPFRTDGRGLGVDCGGVYDCLVSGPTIAELIEQAYLVPPVVYAPPSALNMAGVHTRAGDFDKAETAKAVDRAVITGSAVEHYRRICDGAPAIAFCASVAHAEHVAATFRSAGYRAQSVDGTMESYQRREAIEGLARGRLHVLTSCDLISEGTDVPVVSAAILLRPTKSAGLFLQQVGRALRPVYASGFDLSTVQGRASAISAGGKRAAIILDHVGNCLRHGLPDDPRDWSLDGGLARESENGPKAPAGPVGRQCPTCYRMHRPAPVCPHCGHVYGGAMPKEVAGDLEQIAGGTPDERRAKILAMQNEVRAAQDRERLARIATQRGYKKGWVDYVMAARAEKRGARPVPADLTGTIKDWKGEA